MRPIARGAIFQWAGAVAVVGFAQLFRSRIEIVTGTCYLLGAALLALGGWTMHRRTVEAGFAAVSLFFAARAGTTFWLGLPWHGDLIVLATWGGLARLAWTRGQVTGAS